MLDFDKWPLQLQVLGSIVVVIVTGVSAWFGIKGRKGAIGGDDREERERAERAARYKAERENEILRLESRFERIIESLRVSILGELAKHQETIRDDLKVLNDRLTVVEREVAIIRARSGRQPRD